MSFLAQYHSQSVRTYPLSSFRTLTAVFAFSAALQPLNFVSASVLLAPAASLSNWFFQAPVRFSPDAAQSHRAVAASLDDFIATESQIALQGVLANIGFDGVGSHGSKVAGTSAGLVVASPSKSNPDYFYSWTRDSALTFKALIEANNSSLDSEIQSYVYAQASLQTVSNPSGSLSDGAGLGEPKFEVDGVAFQGAWGRPQRDGPALRATTLISYAQSLISKGDTSTVTSTIWPIISNDLAYVAQYWNQTTFGIWEEVQGSAFWATAVQYRALVEGNALAQKIGKSCSSCVSEAPQVLCFLQSYWNGKYVSANINEDDGRTAIDAATMLASIHIFDPDADCDDTIFQPCSPKALANHKAVVDSFRNVYAINSGIAKDAAVAVGRYSEDVYQGGNPWYLTTLAAAEQLYSALYQWNRIGSITVTSTSLPFFQDFSPSVTAGTYESSSPTYATLTKAIRSFADGFLSVVQTYTPASGSLAEQFSRGAGTPLSAVDLTWSYAAFLTAVARRSGQVPTSWGAPAGGAAVPSSCSASSAQGTYAPPPITTPVGPCASPATQLTVTFNVARQTSFGQTVYVVGNNSAVGSWAPDHGVACSADAYRDDYPRWYCIVDVGIGDGGIEYKYYVKDASGGGYEAGGNRLLAIDAAAAGCERVRSVVDSWQY